MRNVLFAIAAFLSLQAQTVPVAIDLSGVRPGPITVTRDADSVTVTWPDEAARMWRATFSLLPTQPLITSIGLADTGEPVIRSARPFYQGETSKRRGGGDAVFDDSANHPDGTRHVQGTFALRGAAVRTIGDRVE